MGATVVVRSVGGERFTQEIRAGSHTLLGDEPASVGPHTNVPRPTRRTSKPSRHRSVSALPSVFAFTPYFSDSARSPGSFPVSSPDSTACRICSRTR